jgi:CRISPR/Cas system-associated exonuclease Cas4 (RecB family)
MPLDVWAGKIVDKACDMSLMRVRSAIPMTPQELRSWALAYARQTRDESEQGLWRGDPKRYFILYEHYYKEDVPRERWMRIREKVERCVRNLPVSEAFKEITSSSLSDWVVLDKKGERVAFFDMDGIKVYAQIDFTLRRGDGYLLIDWKSGKPRQAEDMDQLSVYALYARSELNCALADLRVAPVYLLSGGKLIEHSLTPEDLDRTRSLVQRSSEEMTQYLYNPIENVARIEDFPITAEVKRCASCNFREICEGANRPANGYELRPGPDDDDVPQ